jgi:glycine dehydrogenase
MLRYIRSLSDKDLALDRSMIPLGSCTMKLNATSEMIPITWPEFANIHPFAPADQLPGYCAAERPAVRLAQPGHGLCRHQPAAQCRQSQGEYAGLLAIRGLACAAWRGPPQHLPDPRIGPRHQPGQRADGRHDGGGGQVRRQGNVDLDDLQAKCEKHSANLAAVMITYPSTYGVFEVQVKELCADGAPPRRPRLCGRRQHERPGGRGRTG